MKRFCLILTFFTLLFFTCCTEAQQEYSANSVLECSNETFPYTCNSRKSCKSFLIFKSRPPYNSVSSISTLMSSDIIDLVRINNVTNSTLFPFEKEVIIPVRCSCSGNYYQANTSFTIPTSDETYLSVANDTFQGLSTCDSLTRSNPLDQFDLQAGLFLDVPLRCACPTKNQWANGTKYLLTYPIFWDDSLFDIGVRFNVSLESMFDANGFSGKDPTIFPFTTILLPLSTQPLSSQTKVHTYKPVVSPEPDSTNHTKSSKRHVYLGLGVAAGSLLGIVSIILLVIFWLYKIRTWKNADCEAKGGAQKDLLVEIASFDQSLKVFTFDELKKATQNFDPNCDIQGSVYRGKFADEVFAIKKMRNDVSKEVKMLSKINHFNLIKLKGVCKHDDCFYLVYEYMTNGSLRDWLGKKKTKWSDGWAQRIRIALDVANGLHYLHNFAEPACVHKDIKSGNILLDSKLRAKISNFSLASTATSDGSCLTTRIVGTRGYMAPEYIDTGLLTPKTDVYAFGVVMLELITGKDAVIILNDQEVLLAVVITSIMEQEDSEKELKYLIDPALGENKIEYAIWVIKLSLMCLKRDPISRPSMSDVASILSQIQIDIEDCKQMSRISD